MENRILTLKQELGHSLHFESLSKGSIFTSPGIEDEPLPIRKAKAFSLFLNNAPIHIYPGELIVGITFIEKPGKTVVGTSRSLPPESISGEGYINSARKKIELGFGDCAYDPVIQILESYGASTRYGNFPAYANEDEKKLARKVGLDENSNPGHLQAGYPRLLEKGWNGIKEWAKQKLSLANTSDQKEFLTSVILSLEAAENFSLRYSKLAEKMSKVETEPQRKKELKEISLICRTLSYGAPKTFREAIQLLWFNHIICHTQGARQLGRFDQYMFPFLEKDLKNEVISSDEAIELLSCLWIKFSSITDVTMDNLQNIILSGQTPKGEDATNILSEMCLEVTDKLGLIDPKISIRLHKGTPSHFMEKISKLLIRGKYQPGLYNDEVIIATLVNIGIPIHDARDYTNDGCSEILVQGKTNPWAFEAKINLLKCLELATQNIDNCGNFNDFFDEVKKEVGIAVEMAISNTNILQEAVPKISPNPYLSATVEGCLEKSLDITEGGATYNSSAVCATGVADTADSLIAIKETIYDDKSVTKKELLKALKNNFEGHERLRQMLINRVPKFGNDSDYVDNLAARLVAYISNLVTRHKNPRGGDYILGLFSYGEYIGHGLCIDATPNGRKKGEGISPNFSPSLGRAANSPFSILKSISKVSPLLTANGTALDLTIHPSTFSGYSGVQKMVSFLKSFIELEVMQIQLNIVDAKKLRAAQNEPDKYQNLTVRLWGFPAYFTRLPKQFQDHLINRAEQKY